MMDAVRCGVDADAELGMESTDARSMTAMALHELRQAGAAAAAAHVANVAEGGDERIDAIVLDE